MTHTIDIGRPVRRGEPVANVLVRRVARKVERLAR